MTNRPDFGYYDFKKYRLSFSTTTQHLFPSRVIGCCDRVNDSYCNFVTLSILVYFSGSRFVDSLAFNGKQS